MRLMRSLPSGLAAVVIFSEQPRAGRAGQDPCRLGGAGLELGFDRAGEEGSRPASRQVLHAGGRALRRHAADDHRARQRRAGNRQPRLFDSPLAVQNANLDDLRIIADEFQDGVSGYHSQRVHGAEGQPDPEGRGSQGQGHRHQRGGQRGRCRDRARCCARSTAWRTSATTPSSRRRSRPCGPCSREEGRLFRSCRRSPSIRNCGRIAARCSSAATMPSALREHARLGGTQVVHRQEPRRHGRFHGGHAAHHPLVPRSEQPRGGGGDRRPRHQAAAGAVRLAVHQAGYYHDPNMLPDLDALQSNVDMTKDLGFIGATSTSRNTPT